VQGEYLAYFIMDTLDSEGYVNLILNRFFVELTEEERLYGYFQQDSAMAHIAGNSNK
jgi:hypothetical protein